jgi:hypothetical protein
MVVQSPLKSEGHRALREWLAREDMIASEFARKTGLAKTLVGMILNCEVPAGPKSARVINHITSGTVGEALWLDRATVDPLTIPIPRSLSGRPSSKPSEGEGENSRAPNVRVEAHMKLHQTKARGQRGQAARGQAPRGQTRRRGAPTASR